VTSSHALLWTDGDEIFCSVLLYLNVVILQGRYFNQATKELSSEWTLMRAGQKDVPTMNEWICQNLSPGSSVGVDAFLVALFMSSYSIYDTIFRFLPTEQKNLKTTCKSTTYV
jgi:hypothetical protein